MVERVEWIVEIEASFENPEKCRTDWRYRRCWGQPITGPNRASAHIGLRAPSGHATAAMSVFTHLAGAFRATFPIIRPSRRSAVAARQERPAAPSLFETVVARCMARDLRAAKLSPSTWALSSPTPSAAGVWPRSATGFDVMLGLAQGEANYTDLENRLA
jgi:hypothetical protein